MSNAPDYFTLTDGTKVPYLTDWDKLMNITEEEIHAVALSDPDANLSRKSNLPKCFLFGNTEMFKRIQRRTYENKQSLTVRYDADVVRFFKSQGKGYQRLMNDVLRVYMENMQQQAVAS